MRQVCRHWCTALYSDDVVAPRTHLGYACKMLRCQSDPRWVQVAIGDLDALLLDHANCERKAAGSALSLIAAYPEQGQLVRRLTSLAIEELRHFHEVCRLIQGRGLVLRPDFGDPYAKALQALARTPREQRLVDRLLVASLIEARSQERLALLGAAIEDPSLAAFYRRLAGAEEGHAALFLELATLTGFEPRLERRHAELAEHEASIVRRLPIEPRIH